MVDHKAIEIYEKARKNQWQMKALLLEMWDNIFHLKYQQGKKILVSDALSRIDIGAEENVHDVIPLNPFQHFRTTHI